MIFSATEAIRLIPPMVMKATKRVKTTAVAMGGTLKLKVIASEMDLTWVKVPIPINATKTPNNANNLARTLECKPF